MNTSLDQENGLASNTDLILTEQDRKDITKLAAKNPAITKLFKIYNSFVEDPSKGWMNTIVIAQRAINAAVLDKTIDITEDGYHKSLLELLKAGGNVAKTIAAAKQEAAIKEEEKKPVVDPDDEDITPITAETA